MANLCVTVSGSGIGDGSDWNNALSASFVPARGNTYYIADGDYGSGKTWNTANSGTTTITIKKATETDHVTDTGWSSDMGDGRAQWVKWSVSTDYWVFDGQQGGGPGDWDFSSGLGFYLYTGTYGDRLILIGGSGTRTSLEFRHIDIASDGLLSTDPADLPVRGFQSTTNPIANVTITRCAFRNIQNVPIYPSDTNGFTVEYSYFYYNRSNAVWHSEMNSRTGLGTNETWRYNLFDRIRGTAVFAGLISTGAAVDGIDIYGNIFYDCVTPLYYYNSGGTYSYINNARIYNNTFVNNGGTGYSQGAFTIQNNAYSGITTRNNLFYENDFNEFRFDGETHTHVWADQNIRSSGGLFDRDAQILAAHTDGELGSGDPFSNYIEGDVLNSDLAASTDSGYDTGVELPGNDYDMFGNPRGAGGVWTRGAIQLMPAPAPRTYPSNSAAYLI